MRSKPNQRKHSRQTENNPGSSTCTITAISDNDDTCSEDSASVPQQQVAGANKGKKKDKGKMFRRTVVAFQLFALFTLLVWLGHIYMFLAVLITQAFLFRELINVRYRYSKALSLPWFRTFHWCCFWSAAFWAHGENCLEFLISQGEEKFLLTPTMVRGAHLMLREFKFLSFVLYATNLIFFVLSLKKGFYKYQMRQFCWTVFVLMIIVVQVSTISDNIFSGFYWFWLPASLVVCNDTFAYFSGKLFGRKFIKRPFLNVSPNKTWEGFIGALLFTVIW
jgi:phosphatidate cytidylyltransferase